MLDRIKHTIDAAILEWKHGHNRRAFIARREAERQATREAAFAALSKASKATIKLGNKATDEQLAALLTEIECLPDAQMFEAGKVLCTDAQVICRRAFNDFALRNSKRFADLAK